MRKKIFLLVSIQLILIGYLAYIIANKYNHISVNKLDRSKIIISEDEFIHFYEPAPNSEDYSKTNCGNFQTVTNADSIVGLTNYTNEKGPNLRRIITIGDSFTHGICVSPSSVWPSLMENYLNTRNLENRHEVINLGFDGYDILYSAIRLKKRGIKYDPDMIVWLMLENDFSENNEELLGKYYETVKTKEFNVESYKKSLLFVREKYKKNKIDILKKNENYLLTISNEISPIPIYAFTYAVEDSDLLYMLKNISVLQSNFKFMKNIPKLEDKEILIDGHPNKLGHIKIMNIIVNSFRSKGISL